ncbi:MAG: histidinol phosphate phosphatase [Arcobacter sp.]|uniref:histidinol-phosphatase n=1 Tax=uncultured Arcobacter sp. TaxID=165434 RepID=UPI000CC82569|nr:histidinol-phosphatase [uncultured Arcobacter sp.]PLY10558.1 MAG: histidinol phosphate phosphatase [Arcobacter sp.]
MRVDLHNHTTLCNHATGTMEEYVKKAIEVGIDEFGFSEHAPMDFDKKYRLDISQKDYYENEVKRLKEEYKNQIKILLAYEVDFMQDVKMLDVILNAKVDYLIGSVHFLDGWGFDNPEFIGKYENSDIDKIWQDYFDTVQIMAKSNYFDIVGHIDLIKIFKFLPKKDIKLIAQDALKEIKKSDMVIEINAAGLRKPINEVYPSKDILELIAELDIPITLSSDAHSIEQIGFKYDEVVDYVKSFGFTKVATFDNRNRKLVNF